MSFNQGLIKKETIIWLSRVLEQYKGCIIPQQIAKKLSYGVITSPVSYDDFTKTSIDRGIVRQIMEEMHGGKQHMIAIESHTSIIRNFGGLYDIVGLLSDPESQP
jgi:hypothetical protein